jgi:hypothetical protein
MVGTIGSAGSRARDNGKFLSWFGKISVPHAVASLLGGGLMGLVGGFLGGLLSVSPELRLIVALVAVGAGVILEIAKVPANLLARAKQVPLSWKHVFPAPMSAALYGATLGTGVASSVYFWSFWVTVAAVIAVGSPVAGFLIGAVYGVGRTTPVFVAVGFRPDKLLAAVSAWQSATVGVRVVSVLAMALTAGGLIVALQGGQ